MQVLNRVYTSSTGWLHGSGYLVVGEPKYVTVTGTVDDPTGVVGAGNIAVLQSASTFKLPAGECSVAVTNGEFLLTLATDGQRVSYSGFITGKGSLRIEVSSEGRSEREPLELSGAPSNSYQGTTTLVRGVLKLNKPADALAVPGNLTLGGSTPDNQNDGVIWGAPGQLASSAVVTLEGTQPSFLDLGGQRVTLGKVVMSKAGQVRTGKGGSLQVKQLHVGGARLADGTYSPPQPWLDGSGTVTVDARVDVLGTYGAPDIQIGPGNIANMTGDTKIAYPASSCDLDVQTNGFTLTLDSGDGNPFSCAGSIKGEGNVEFFMGPSYTGYKDAPLRLTGDRANTSTGKFLIKKGRVQLEKPAGVDAISGDVVVGGQGFNDCLFWKNSDQLKDTVNITLIDAGNSGAAYLHLNGCIETAASLTMTSRNKVKTDSPDGGSGTLTVKSLVIGGVGKAAGVYTAKSEGWIDGRGKVIVLP
jgi:autotransporter-associated beta strand protein